MATTLTVSVKERAVVEVYAATGGRIYAEKQTEMRLGSGLHLLRKKECRNAILQVQQARLTSEALPLAVKTLFDVVSDSRANAAAGVNAAKEVLARTMPSDNGMTSKEPHEMSAEELAEAIARLEDVAAGRAREATYPEADPTGLGSVQIAEEEGEGSIFG